MPDDQASSRVNQPVPPRAVPRIIAAPKLRQVYWCDFWRDTRMPEFWKTRPIIVVSYKNTLHGPCLVIPTSTKRQTGNPWAFEITPCVDGRRSWAVCNHLYTVSPSRLSQVGRHIPIVSKVEFNEILKRLNVWLPVPFPLDE